VPIDLTNVDEVLKLLADKLVKTEQGSYIKVDDLRALMEDYGEQRRREEPLPIRDFTTAKLAAKADPEVQAAFKESPIAAEALKS
jgi:hypothetical protein